MKQKLTATLGCLVFSCALSAQTNWLPPVTLPANSNACDPSAWKLVFYDDFNGTALSNKWTTQVMYDEGWVCRGGWNVQRSEHPYHTGARESAGPSIFKDENIYVSNGICKMYQWYDPNSSWTVRDSSACDHPLVTQYADLTTAMIRLPQEGADRVRKGYSSGRFQARMKQPNFQGAWPAFWMWPGRGGVDEIDMTEAWAGPGLHPVHFNAVAWSPAIANLPNPYNLPNDVHMNRDYPYQSWLNYLFRSFPGVKYLNKEDWHTYTYEWDTASISAQLDNETPAKIWKYYKTQTYFHGQYINGQWYPYYNPYTVVVGSGCNPGNGSWQITSGYPWNNDTANCDVRISSGYTGEARDKYHNMYGIGVHLLGTLEVDFVKIWQRHPEKDNHTEVCADNTYPAPPTISGPSEVCPIGQYTLSPAVSGGYWDASYQFALSSTSSSGATLSKNAGPSFNGGWISYHYSNGIEGCPYKSVSQGYLYCNQSTDWVVASPYVATNRNESRFHLISELYFKRDVISGTTPVVTWNVSINPGRDSYDARTAQNYTLRGQFVSTPVFPTPVNGSYNLRWTMNVTDASGTWSRSGERNSTTPLMQQKTDPNTFYLNAYIDDEDSYDAVVADNVASNMVSEDEYGDNLFMDELIEKKRMDALEPYLITDGLTSSRPTSLNMPDSNANELSAIKSNLKVYPNPITSDITIIAGSDFKDRVDIELNIYDLLGRSVYSNVLHYQKGNLMKADLSKVPSGNYILKLRQGNNEEHIKITKTEE
ncbi:Por secretion system C-terminal sorting domain-containing protein [Mucilaginibacter pineti]|uniref:Por secretion system C-terminal sorting domain-containing protein n=1 Tax=Mucilaginibacter pineti TaxID=1391627 RepID=A0A1G7GCZ3_9SPHI|nr:T9SS type A sorting domain-containing protein [Mucilaginibacter pineti]SDE85953.1 Por secretion system C-terminal sorting domain-containing protein [Mucilaginibacter pineti]